MGDAAEVICRALTNPTLKARHCNVGGEHRSLADAVEIIKALIPGARIKLGSQHRVRPLINMEVLKRELGFTPTWKLEDQLAELVKQARETLALTETT
jgi:nucleoside-diphosphate-sugar epimerase